MLVLCNNLVYCFPRVPKADAAVPRKRQTPKAKRPVRSRRMVSILLLVVAGAIAWVGLCLGAGLLFGNVPIVKDNFSLVTIGIVFVSVLPVVFELVKSRRRR